MAYCRWWFMRQTLVRLVACLETESCASAGHLKLRLGSPLLRSRSVGESPAEIEGKSITSQVVGPRCGTHDNSTWNLLLLKHGDWSFLNG